jgi:hypothetical protein
MANWFNLFPIILILASLLGLLIFNSWRRSVICLAILYLGQFILLVQVNPLTLSAVKLISGWMSALLLGLLIPKEDEKPGSNYLANQIFKVLANVLIWVIAFLITKSTASIFSLSPEIVFASFVIFGSGLLQLGLRSKPLSVILGILTVFAGFELLYASLEMSVLINGLLAAINLLIALIGYYFEDHSPREEIK